MKYLAAACGGELVAGQESAEVSRVCTDSRIAGPGDLFVALAGERFDAHDFVEEVIGKGVTAVLVSKDRLPKSPLAAGVIAVTDTRIALGKLGARYREDWKLPVVAVAGSNGKTTTKELIASVLRQRFETLWSEASFNNDIGVPLTLLNLNATHRAAVLEVGTNHPGELAPLIRCIAPRYGVITSIGREHLEFFHNIEGVAKEEGSLAELLPTDGVLFINGDTAEVGTIRSCARCRVVQVGANAGGQNDWQATDVRVVAEATHFRVKAPNNNFDGEYSVGLLGRHQVTNALLAMAVGAELGLTREELLRGLVACTPPKMRLQISTVGGRLVINDAYNANADSMLVALQTLKDLPVGGRRVAVLGDMGELGDESVAAHTEVGARVAELKLDLLVTVGERAKDIAMAAKAGGMGAVEVFETVESALGPVRELVRAGDTVLVKASRATRLERVIEAWKI
ncbi:MAG TPA: UDP-N-acetylmuramoyl-tripeptide--D-alanyl-D-alanine ligase [Roseimicrobium sp.]|nr:UDP-N-acetylmuramoyl-tripeptide--D-alanyl-D-alanine ligase [Roseimicrobium sp.]